MWHIALKFAVQNSTKYELLKHRTLNLSCSISVAILMERLTL